MSDSPVNTSNGDTSLDHRRTFLLSPAVIWRNVILAYFLLNLIVWFSLSPIASQWANIASILYSTAILGLLAVGCTIVIVTGGIDLSVGTLMTLCSVIAAVALAYWDAPLWVGAVAGILCGALCGATSGVIITKMRVPPYIATLSMMLLFKGLSLIISDGKPIYLDHVPNISVVAGGSLIGYVLRSFPIPNAAIVLLVVSIGVAIILGKTNFGRRLSELGKHGHAHPPDNAGDAYRIAAYSLSGAICGLGGLIMASRLNSAQPALGQGYELTAIAAVLLGGTSLRGGSGTIFGTLIGSIIIAAWTNALNIAGVGQYYSWMIFPAVIIILAVFVDNLRRGKAR
jgi:ribose transport system permease protein